MTQLIRYPDGVFESWRKKLAEWLWPQYQRQENQYHQLLNQISQDQRWLGEFDDVRDTLDRLMDGHVDYWREPNAVAVSRHEQEISRFREHLRTRGAAADWETTQDTLRRRNLTAVPIPEIVEVPPAANVVQIIDPISGGERRT